MECRGLGIFIGLFVPKTFNVLKEDVTVFAEGSLIQWNQHEEQGRREEHSGDDVEGGVVRARFVNAFTCVLQRSDRER